MTAAASTDRLARALDATGELIAAIGPDQWSNPTPCPEWNVRGLVNHIVFGSRMFAAILGGGAAPSRESLPGLRAIDQLGADPVAAYRRTGADLVAAFADPTVPERVFNTPTVGSVPGAVMLHLRVTETLVHGWDLAMATGQPARLPDDIAEAELAFSRSRLAPDVPRTGNPFGPAQPIAEAAPAIDRLAAYLGRPVTPDAGPASWA